MQDQPPDTEAPKVEPPIKATARCAAANKEPDNDEGDHNGSGCAEEVERQWQWQIVTLAKAVRRRGTSLQQARRGEQTGAPSDAASSVTNKVTPAKAAVQSPLLA